MSYRSVAIQSGPPINCASCSSSTFRSNVRIGMLEIVRSPDGETFAPDPGALLTLRFTEVTSNAGAAGCWACPPTESQTKHNASTDIVHRATVIGPPEGALNKTPQEHSWLGHHSSNRHSAPAAVILHNHADTPTARNKLPSFRAAAAAVGEVAANRM